MTKLKQHQPNNKLQVVHRNIERNVLRAIESIDKRDSINWVADRKIAFPIKGGIALYHPDEIYYCEAHGNYTKIYFANNDSVLLSKTIKDVNQMLPKKQFIRCHQSYIINKNHVRQCTIDDGLVLDKIAVSIPVSRRNRKNIMVELTSVG